MRSLAETERLLALWDRPRLFRLPLTPAGSIWAGQAAPSENKLMALFRFKAFKSEVPKETSLSQAGCI